MSDLKILIGGEVFSEIRRNNYYYVDKTGFLNKFLPLSAKVSLITRPRRFGKTLFMSMLSEFFDIAKKSSDLFSGLKVSANKDLCNEWMNKYPVIFFSLKDVEGNSFSDSLEEIQRVFSSFVIGNSYLLKSNDVDTSDKKVLSRIKENNATVSEIRNFLMILTRAMCYHHQKPAIVLIDEYDVPVAKAEENGYYDEMIKFMRGFLSSALKTSQENLMFAILTGCLRITKESIFTGLNNLKCYDISDSDYANTFGFTQDEVDTLLADAGLSSKKEEVREWYDGYRFGKNQEIYCPWSILNYVVDHKNDPQRDPKAYWLNTSGNELVQRLIAHNPTDLTDTIDSLLAGNVLPVHINYATNYKNLTSTAEDIWSLLYLTGYLTKAPKEVADEFLLPGSGMDILAIPNKEVTEIFKDELKKWFSHRLTSLQRTDLLQAFWKPDAELFVKLLSQTLLVSISMYDYQEHFYHGMLTGIFLSTKAQTVSNLEAGEGRSDILVRDRNMAAVIEIKRAKVEKELPALVEKGMQQIIDNQYDARFRINSSINTILHWSIAFYKKSCMAKAIVVKDL